MTISSHKPSSCVESALRLLLIMIAAGMDAAAIAVVGAVKLGHAPPVIMLVTSGLLLIIAVPGWMKLLFGWLRAHFVESSLVLLAASALWVAGFLVLGSNRMLSWRDRPNIVVAVVLLVEAGGLCLVALRTLFSRLLLRAGRYSFYAGIGFSFILFTSVAGVMAYFAWIFATRAHSDSKASLTFAIGAGIAVAFALWGRDLVRRVRKVGAAGVELDVWQEIVRIPELQDPPEPPTFTWLSKDCEVAADPTWLSQESLWYYELASSHLFHLRHLGVRPQTLGGEDLRRYRGIALWVGKTALYRLELHKALDVLAPLEYQSDASGDELYYIGMSYLNVAKNENENNVRPERYSDRLAHAAECLRRAVMKIPDHAGAH